MDVLCRLSSLDRGWYIIMNWHIGYKIKLGFTFGCSVESFQLLCLCLFLTINEGMREKSQKKKIFEFDHHYHLSIDLFLYKATT